MKSKYRPSIPDKNVVPEFRTAINSIIYTKFQDSARKRK